MRDWYGYAWNLQQPQRVDEAIRVISCWRSACTMIPSSSAQRPPRTSACVARRAAELRLVTATDLAEVDRAARMRKFLAAGLAPAQPSS